MTSLPQTTQRTCLRQKHTATPAQRSFSILHFTLHDDDRYDKDEGHLLERRNMPRESRPCWMCPLHPLHSRCTVAFKVIFLSIIWLVFILIMLQNFDIYDKMYQYWPRYHDFSNICQNNIVNLHIFSSWCSLCLSFCIKICLLTPSPF